MRKHNRREYIRKQRKERYIAANTNDKLIINLRDLSHTMRCLYEGRCSQKRILMVLNEVDVTTQHSLIERLDVRAASISEVTAKLENAGLVTRKQSEGDRRAVEISLTDRGRELAVQAQEQRDCRHKEMFSCLTEDEKINLLSLLEKLNADWERRFKNEAEGGYCDRSRKHCSEREM